MLIEAIDINKIYLKGRTLSSCEIDKLESQGNWSEDWNLVRYCGECSDTSKLLPRVWRSGFIGIVLFHDFDRPVKIKDSEYVFHPSGIFDSTLSKVILGNNVLIKNCSLVLCCVIEEGAALLNCDKISCTGDTFFSNDLVVSVGPECGGRDISVCWSLSYYDVISAVLSHGKCNETMKQYIDKNEKAKEMDKCKFSVVKTGAYLKSCPSLVDIYIGENAYVHNTILENVTILSKFNDFTIIDGAQLLKNSILQEGCKVGIGATVCNTFMLEHSEISFHAKVSSTILAPDSHISSGECHHSLVGPFVGFHHQSLLISAIWPLGRGNMGYGCNVGSNHTGRKADQEIWVGEGIFFGLSTVIKYPCNLIEAPFTIIASGITCLPQLMTFPFSLINSPTISKVGEKDIPLGLNQLYPGWVLAESMYTVVRNELKYATRSTAKNNFTGWAIFSQLNIRLILNARERLLQPLCKVESPCIDLIYTDKDIYGIGKNFITEESRLRGIDIYTKIVKYYLLSRIVEKIEDKSWTINLLSSDLVNCSQIYPSHVPQVWDKLILKLVQVDNIKEENEFLQYLLYKEFNGSSASLTLPSAMLNELLMLSKEVAHSVEKSKLRDESRGVAIIPGYHEVQEKIHDDEVVKYVWEKHKNLERVVFNNT